MSMTVDTDTTAPVPTMPITPLGDEVIVWTKPSCVQCTATKKDLERKGVAFREVDITDHPEAIDALRDANRLAMPAVQFRDEMWGGFQPDKIKEVAARIAA